LSTDAGSIKAIVGGQPTIRITTGVLNTFEDNTLVRIDGTLGSTQLNNQTFYAKVITPTQFDIYSQPYNPAFGATNSPVTNVSTWLGGGYAWRDGLFTIIDTKATATAPNGLITVNSTTELILGTPVYFTVSGTALGSTIMGGLIAGREYFVNQIVPGTGFYVTETRGGNNLALTSDTGGVNVTQWQQTNVDRLWVTVNGYRVPSSSLRLNPGNDLSILASINPGDEVIITSMVPSATPNQMTYYMNVNQLGVPVVYNANMSKTWLVRGLESLDTVIYVNDVSQITETIVQNNIAPAPVGGVISIGLNVDKRTLTSVTVYNNTTGQTVPSSAYSVQVIDASPTLLVTGGVTAGDYLTITAIQGNMIYINGEQIVFGVVDFATNTLTQLQRGANGTATQTLIAPYTPVLGLLPGDRLSDTYYNQTWNPIPGIYNLTEGDPLQIADTAPATFLNTGK